MTSTESRIRDAYEALLRAFGPQGWWPGDSSLEVALGAVLTQNTAWRNAELALERLKSAGALSATAIGAMAESRLAELIRPAGFPLRKARTILGLIEAGERAGGWTHFLELEGRTLRRALLAVWGVGPETADAIALYAAGYPTFVVDQYTVRYALRHRLVGRRARYDTVRRIFEEAVGRDVRALRECHALLVRLGKEFCRPTPRCGECPLQHDLEPSGLSSPNSRAAKG